MPISLTLLREQRHDGRVFRLFNCSFHHFDDETAKQILQSTMETSDGFAIIELQDRRFFMMLMMFFNVVFTVPLVLSTCRLRRPWWHFTYCVPNLIVYPILWAAILFVLWFDGLVSCLRTREFNEFTKIVKKAAEVDDEPAIKTRTQDQDCLQVYDVPNWEIRSHEKIIHTLPCGYVRMITGVRRVPS